MKDREKERVSERNGAKEEAECSGDYPDRISTSKVSDNQKRNHVLSSSLSS